jgi:hypothetical protein
LVGEFNGWAPNQHPLTLLDDGRFRTELPLPVGQRWRFRYILDGERWENDWAADDYVPNGLGADDSVVDLTNPQGIPLSQLVPPTAGGGTADLAEDSPAESTAVAGQGVDGSASVTLPSSDEILAQPRRHWWQLWRRKLTAA